jgi:hypothetical protein
MGIRSSYWKTRLALTSPESVETLTAIEGFFQGGRRWTQGVYHASNGQKCLVGAADHLRASSVDTAKFWLERAIAEKTGGAVTRIENFNDSRRSFSEIAEVINRAKQLALQYHGRQAPARPALTYQPDDDQGPVIEVTEADMERVALLSRRQRKPSNFHD